VAAGGAAMTDATSRPALALARVEADGDVLWTVRRGDEYAPLGLTLSELLRLPAAEARAVIEGAAGASIRPDRLLAPIDPAQEVWGAGVTYLRSRDGRIDEARDGTPYDRVYAAERPELFFKAVGVRVVGSGEPIGVRADSAWNVPEPELGIVLDSRGDVFGYVAGDDVSSRSIEGENPLYLPQAKSYSASCALGPEIVQAWTVQAPFAIELTVRRGGAAVFAGSASTTELTRSPEDLGGWLFRALEFPDGVVLLTGTGIVPDADFTLSPGDEVEIAVEGVGILANPVVSVGRAGRD